MALTSSLNCLSRGISSQSLHSLNAFPSFSEKALFFSEVCARKGVKFLGESLRLFFPGEYGDKNSTEESLQIQKFTPFLPLSANRPVSIYLGQSARAPFPVCLLAQLTEMFNGILA